MFVIFEENSEYKTRIMSDANIVHWIEILGFSAYKKNGVIVLTKKE
jgi:hypothetical protein